MRSIGFSGSDVKVQMCLLSFCYDLERAIFLFNLEV